MSVIFHMDMDAFFVACEVRENPSLEGKPVVVGADPKGGSGRGVVSTASYAARAKGVHSALPISIAYRKCPECIYLPVNMQLYIEMSRKIFSIIRGHVLKMEQSSIDEAFFMTGDKTYEEAKRTAEEIKSLVRKEGFTCSVGIGPNKTVAKIASDFKKPDGLTIVKPEEVSGFLAPLPVRKLPGIGPKTESFLGSRGIKSVGDIASKNENYFRNLGKWGAQMFWLANGYGSDVIEDERGAKSVSREMTFEKDTKDEKIIRNAIDELSESLYSVISRHKMSFSTVTVKVRYEGFQTYTRQKTLKFPAGSVKAIYETADELVAPFLAGRKKIRLIGLKISGFETAQTNVNKFLK